MTKITAKGLLKAIERNVFPGIDLTAIALGTEDEQRVSRLEQAERLFGTDTGENWALWLSDQFYTSDRELIMIEDPHPFLYDSVTRRDPEETDLDETEYQVMEWVEDLAYFCHELYTHEPYATDYFIGVKHSARGTRDAFYYSNKPLVDWIRTTTYRRIAALTLRAMLDVECDKAMVTNQAVQDYYANECYHLSWDVDKVDECETFITRCLDGMDEMYRHHERGLALGLTEEQIRVADALWEYVPHNYTDDTVACAREFCLEAERLMPKRPYIKSENGVRQYQREAMEALKKIADRYEIDFEPYKPSSLAASYTAVWLYDKYYK
jgi:hypothetical protein